MAIAFVMFLILGSGGGGEEEIKLDKSKKLRQPETTPIVPVPAPVPAVSDNTAQLNDEYQKELEEEDLEIEVETAMEEMDEAEEEEIEVNDSMLVAAVKSVEDNVKFYLGKVFGSGEDEDESQDDDESSGDTSEDVKLTGEQLDEIANKISERLENSVKTEFRARADEITEEKVGEIDQVIAEDRNAGLDAEEVSIFACMIYHIKIPCLW